ncbi:MAG: hypothetical protein P9X27_05055, partial [Candidatus Kaelpia aquatica]|nr:hypothetical protein [Candidatus Kaelpia aquatica]
TGSNDDVTLTTTSGNIIMSGDITALNDEVVLVSAANVTDITDGTSDISAANLDITASGTVGAIGTNNELDTDVDTLTIAAQGDTYVLEENDITLTSVVTTVGLIDVEAAGTITLNVVTAAGAVDLYATAGDIVDNTTGTTLVTAGADSSLKASGIIGTAINPHDPVDVSIDGDLWVWSGSETDEVSVILAGYVNSSSDTERVELLLPATPGLVILDNRLMGGSNYGSGSSGGSILNRGYGFVTIEKSDMFNFFYARALETWGYKIAAPWVLSEANFIDAGFLEGPEVIIDGSAVGVNILPRELLIAPAIFQPQNYYIIRQIKR